MSHKLQRLTQLDFVTGIAIFLVVLGHLASRQDPSDIEWYVNIKILIYKFHMPLFMFVSGSIAYYTFSNSYKTYLDYIKKKSLRLLPGFFLFGFLIILGKFILNNYIHIDNASSTQNILDDIYKMIFMPTESVARSLWYIYVLFLFYLIMPYIYKINKFTLLGISIVIHLCHIYFNITTFLILDKFAEYFLYFVIGFFFITSMNKVNTSLLKNYKFVYLFFFSSFLFIPYINDHYSKLFIGMLSIPFFLVLALHVKSIFLIKMSQLFSSYTFTIYLMNTIFIGVSKAFLLKFLNWGGTDFIIMFPVLLCSGLFLPIVFHKLILKYTILDKYTK